MSVRRLVATGAAMGLVAVVLAALTPSIGEMTTTVAAAQQTVDAAGADSLVIAAVGLLAWLVWAWGAVGLTLTAASVLPGMLGVVASAATRVVLPAGARHSAALALGLGLSVAAPLAGVVVTVTASPAMASATAGAVPDWPVTPPPQAPGSPPAPPSAPEGAPAPDWPADASPLPPDDAHVVVRGDCLWHIVAERLLNEGGTPPTDGEIARAVRAWWTTNADVIGADPDRLLPGQVLRPPGPA